MQLLNDIFNNWRNNKILIVNWGLMTIWAVLVGYIAFGCSHVSISKHSTTSHQTTSSVETTITE